VNGAPVVTEIDIVKAVGPKTALVKSIPVTVTGGKLTFTVKTSAASPAGTNARVVVI
jgi:hypothetical protein